MPSQSSRVLPSLSRSSEPSSNPAIMRLLKQPMPKRVGSSAQNEISSIDRCGRKPALCNARIASSPPSTPTVPSYAPAFGIASMCDPVATAGKSGSDPVHLAKVVPTPSSRHSSPASSQSPHTQARAFCRWVGKLAPNEIPMVDIEAVSGDQNGRAEAWFAIVDRKLGLSELPIQKRSWLYSGEFILTHQLTRVCASGRNIWVAAYGPDEPRLHHILWQSTDGTYKPRKNEKWPGARIRWPGAGKCDTNVYHGKLNQLVSAVSRDDLPYPRKKLVQMVQRGVAAELRTKLDGTGTTLAQGAQAAVGTEQGVADLTRQVADLAGYLKQQLPDPQGMEHVSTR